MTVLSPYEANENSDWYTGTANAIYQNIRYIDSFNPEYVLILGGDHIYKMDYQYLYWLETTDRLFKIDFKELKRLYPNVEKTLDISISERIIDFGKYKGQKFRDIKDDISYLEWLVSIDKISIEDFELLSTI